MIKNIFFKELFKLSTPIIIGQVGIMLIGVGDVLVASAHSPLSLASIGVAVSILNPIFLFGIGLMMGVSSFVSIEIGKEKNLDSALKSSLFFALMASIALMLITYAFSHTIDYFGLVPEMVPFIKSYINIVLFSFPFAYFYQVIKEFLQAYERVNFTNSVAIVGAIINIPLNYCLVFGKFGLPKLGFDGMAYASLLIRFIMAAIVIYPLRDKIFNGLVDRTYLKSLMKFSFPIASMIFFEVLGFCLFGVLAGKFGVIEAATNNLILNIASLTFMVPLSISSAVSVKVGNSFGQKSYSRIKGYSIMAIAMSMGFMLFTAVMYLLFSKEIMSLLSDDLKIVTMGAAVLFVVAIFQLVDGLQVTLAGVLRGLDKTKESFIGIIIGFWIIGIPLGVYLGFYENLKLIGLWVGLAISLAVVGVLLTLITRSQFKKFKSNKDFS